jgi:multidrug efflux pump subunit AcrA (membrane-fusion protein)
VREGSRVKEGDVLVEISDVDTEYFNRLKMQRDAAAQKLTAKEEELQAYQTQVTNLQATQTLRISTARCRVDVARQRVSAGCRKI